MYTFDGVNRLIILSPGVMQVDAQDLYSAWKEWVVAGANLAYAQAFDVVGGNPTTGANAIANYYFLQNGWRVRPQEAHHTLTITGILLGADGSELFADTLGAWRVRIVQVVPLQAETISVAGGGGSGPTAIEIANKVWTHPFAETLLTVKKFLGLA